MSQFDVAKRVLDAEGGVNKSELVNQINLSKSAVEASINDLVGKGYIVKEDGRYYWHPETDEETIEDIRPRSLGELDF